MSQRKTYMLVDIKALKKKKKKKRREKAFMEELKTFQAKQTLHLSTLFQLYPGEVHSTTLHK